MSDRRVSPKTLPRMAHRAHRGVPAGTRFLAVIVLPTTTATYMVLPLLAVSVAVHGHMTTAEVGTLLAATTFVSGLLPVFTGPLADRYGGRRSIVVGLALVGVSYVGLAFIGEVWEYVIDLFIMGSGLAIFQPSAKSALVIADSVDERNRTFALRNVIYNGGAAAGAALSTVFLGIWTDRRIFFVAGCVYLGLVVLTRWTTPSSRKGARPAESLRLRDATGALRDRHMLGLVCVAIGFWALSAQMTLTVPLSLDHLGLERLIGLVFSANAGLVICMQLPAARAVRHVGWAPSHILVVGLALLAIAFAFFALVPFSWVFLVPFVVVFTVGELLVAPTMDVMVSLLAPAAQRSTYFGVMSLGWAVGTGLGTLGGGLLLQASGRAHLTYLFWLGIAVVGVVVLARALRMRNP